MVVGKWNYEKHDYDPHRIPDRWNTPTYTQNMDEIVNCAQCGRELSFGETYTSLEIHSSIGFGYPVCKGCYNEEWERRNDSRGKE